MTGHPATGVRGLAARIDAATPPHRDRTVDALRALAIAGVILGHWLVTALVLTLRKTGSKVHDASPLSLAARPHPRVVDLPDARRLLPRRRLRRRAELHRGLPFLAAQAPGPADPPGGGVRGRVGAARDSAEPRRDAGRDRAHGAHAGARSAVVPGGVRRADGADPAGRGDGAPPRRVGRAVSPPPSWPAVDLARFGLGGPAWLGWINVGGRLAGPLPAGHRVGAGLVPRLARPGALLAGGAAATAALIAWAGYPASMVGVNGQHISNLNPPTLAAVTFGIAQVGLACCCVTAGPAGCAARWPGRRSRRPTCPR